MITAKKGKVKHRVAPFLQLRIQQEVNSDALVEWAQREEKPFEVIPPMPNQAWRPTPLKAFISRIIP